MRSCSRKYGSPFLDTSSISSKGKTHWIPDKEDPSFTSTNARVFCFLTVLTHPLIATSPSVGAASTVLILFKILDEEATSESVSVLMESFENENGEVVIEVCLEAEPREDPVKAETDRIGLVRRAVAQIAAMRHVLAIVFFPDFTIRIMI